MCDVAAQFHIRHKLSRDHRVLSLAEVKTSQHLAAIPVFCSEHNEPFRYFDKDCGHVICRDCQALEHNGHKCCSLAEASAQSRQELDALTSKAKGTAAQLKEAEERVMTVVNDLNRKKKHEEDKIHAFFEELRASLDAREQALVTKLSQIHKAKSFILTEQCDLLRTFEACLLSAVDRAVTAIQSAGDVQWNLLRDIYSTCRFQGRAPAVYIVPWNSYPR
ncbi:unnamed protein product [Porites evermanni]|uniref:B box-type domain-containing protein n=1 Tax=Porites evermanni TaxID=104178 RepID=A0ABN8M9B4_9CNID|nr:unnamed protein product [Porites evermanni]